MDVGLDRLGNEALLLRELRSARVGLMAHPASVNRDLAHALDVFAGLGIAPRILFGPEHGWSGQAQDMIGVDDTTTSARARIVSLYGERYEDLSPKPEHLAEIDTIVIDLQDVGARYYTFIWTAVLFGRACKRAGKRVVVLDRPNPIGHTLVEGRVQDRAFLSFVGLEPIPVRHGLTLGEIVAWRAKVEGWNDLVTVLSHRGLEPSAEANTWDRHFVLPSPNMPTHDTARVYPGGCLLEGTNLSDGRGTTRPFEITGAPWVDGEKLAKALAATELPGFVARPLSFEPTFHKHGKKTCGGVQIHVLDARTFQPYATYLALIAAAHHQAPKDFAFRTEKYEYVDHIPAFDILTGSAAARERILANEEPRAIAASIAKVGDEERAVIEEAKTAKTSVRWL